MTMVGLTKEQRQMLMDKLPDVANLVFHYQPGKVNILNNGHTIQVNNDALFTSILQEHLNDIAIFNVSKSGSGPLFYKVLYVFQS